MNTQIPIFVRSCGNIAFLIVSFAIAHSVKGGGEYNLHFRATTAPVPDEDHFNLKVRGTGSYDICLNTINYITIDNDSPLAVVEVYNTIYPNDNGTVRRWKAFHAVTPGHADCNGTPVWYEDFVSGTCLGCDTQTDGGPAIILGVPIARDIYVDDPHEEVPPNTKCNDHKSAGTSCPTCTDEIPCQNCMTPMAQYSIHSMLVSLNVQDTPLRYTPPRGPPINFTVTYNERDSVQQPIQSYSNLGPKWTFGWLSYVVETRSLNPAETVTVYVPGGGAEIYRYYPPAGTYLLDGQSHTWLEKESIDVYKKHLPDGSIQVFNHPSVPSNNPYPRKIFMTKIVDPDPETEINIHYEGTRIEWIEDALDQRTELIYDDPNDPLRITKVVEPTFGDPNHARRHAEFEYDPTEGTLTRITDEIGIVSAFTYITGPEGGRPDVLQTITTPYGLTTFERGRNDSTRGGRWIEATDPENRKGTSRISRQYSRNQRDGTF